MKPVFRVVSLAIVVAAIVAVAGFVFHVDVPLSLVVTVLVGAVCLAWLVVIVVLPWNLHFAARHLLNEIAASRARGIAVDDAHESRARVVARRMLVLSLGLHVGSAALLGVGSWLYGENYGENIGLVFAALFFLSTFFRPAVEYYRYVRRLLSDALSAVRYPRDDVVKLVDDVAGLVRSVEQQERALHDLKDELSRVRKDVVARTDDSQKKLEMVSRRFEETIDRLTDNQEIISGLKAFLRLVQRPAGT